jgi:hypothetical protein
LIRSNHDLKPVLFRDSQKLAVDKAIPALFRRRSDFMNFEKPPKLVRDVLSNRMRKALGFGKLFYGRDEAQIDPVRTCHCLRRHAILEIIEDRLNRHTFDQSNAFFNTI